MAITWTDPASGNTYGRNDYGGTYQISTGSPAKPAAAPNPTQPNYNLYNTAVSTQAKDYGNIMDLYNALASKAATPASDTDEDMYKPQSYAYKPSDQAMSSINNLQSLSQTGGYAPGDAANIRARAISPIRSIYSSAESNIDRNRTLRGSSTGYAATKAKLARDMSQQISDATTNAEASIAGDVARNKISITPSYASAVGAESSLANQYGRANTDATNEAAKYNATVPLQYAKLNQGNTAETADVLGGMRSLYGTTPALSSLFGSQAMSAAELQNMIDQQKRASGQQTIGQILGSLR